MKHIAISDIMTRFTVTASPDENLLECAKKMVRKKIRSLPIVNKEGELVGFLSQTDILWAFVKKPKSDLSEIKAIDISPKKIRTVKQTESIEKVIEKMNKLKFDRLPVVNKKKLVGLITVRDILGFNPGLYPELEEFAKIKEEQEKLSRIESREVLVTKDGICEECGNRDALYRHNGMLVCDSCRNF